MSRCKCILIFTKSIGAGVAKLQRKYSFRAAEGCGGLIFRSELRGRDTQDTIADISAPMPAKEAPLCGGASGAGLNGGILARAP